MRTKPFTGTNRTAYDRIDDLSTLAADYKGCRRVQHFIATPEALAAKHVSCPTCGLRVEDEHNRGMFDPKKKLGCVQHYACSWQTLLTAIYNTPIPLEA